MIEGSITARSKPRPTNEGRAHAIAQRLVFEHFGDWRYDPGDPKFKSWYRKAKRVLKAIRDYEEAVSRG